MEVDKNTVDMEMAERQELWQKLWKNGRDISKEDLYKLAHLEDKFDNYVSLGLIKKEKEAFFFTRVTKFLQAEKTAKERIGDFFVGETNAFITKKQMIEQDLNSLENFYKKVYADNPYAEEIINEEIRTNKGEIIERAELLDKLMRKSWSFIKKDLRSLVEIETKRDERFSFKSNEVQEKDKNNLEKIEDNIKKLKTETEITISQKGEKEQEFLGKTR